MTAIFSPLEEAIFLKKKKKLHVVHRLIHRCPGHLVANLSKFMGNKFNDPCDRFPLRMAGAAGF